MSDETPRQQILKRLTALKSERATWDAHWKELAEYIQPRRSRFFNSEINQGTKKNEKIINSRATLAVRTTAAGLAGGITSEAQPWFRLTTQDPELAESGSVRSWLHVAEERVRHAFSRSNLYKALPLMYVDLVTMGTAAMLMEDDEEQFFRFYVLPVGSYCLSNNKKLQVDTCAREPGMTVRQLVQMFGLDKCSQQVRNAYERGSFEQWVEVVHVIQPNEDAKYGAAGAAGMKWKSCWMEAGGVGANAGDREAGFLRESGYEEFPVLCPRWSVTGEDVYGSSPAMDVLGDVKALQLLEKRKAEAVDKIVRPPMRGPAELRNQRASILPGDMTYVGASVGPGSTFSPAMEIRSDAVTVLGQSIQEHEQRVWDGTYADIMRIFVSTDDPKLTATEVIERKAEKLQQLGPVFGQLKSELLQPLVTRALAILFRNGDLPPPPEEIQGTEVRFEFVGIVEQAQKLTGTQSIRELASFVGNLAAAVPDVLDKVNWDQAVDEMGNALGVKPELLNSDEQVAKIRAERSKQQAQQAQMEQAGAMAQGAKVLSETDTSGDNALTRVLGQVPGSQAQA